MKQIITGMLATMMISVPAQAQMSEGKTLAELTFESSDKSGKGYLNQGDMEARRNEIFHSVDADDSSTLELSEFLGWGYGFQSIAEDKDKVLAYRTALKVVYSFWDVNGDGKITQTEHRKATIRDFNRADLNNDAILEKDEFVNGYSVLVAIRAALKAE